MADRFVYPAIFTYEEDGITVTFPDLPGCITSGESEDDAIRNAKEALEGFIYFTEEDNEELPKRTESRNIRLEENQTVLLVDVWMVPVRDEMKNRSIKKTLTVPKWLNDVAEENHVNFSQLLQSALKQYLGYKDQ